MKYTMKILSLSFVTLVGVVSIGNASPAPVKGSNEVKTRYSIMERAVSRHLTKFPAPAETSTRAPTQTWAPITAGKKGKKYHGKKSKAPKTRVLLHDPSTKTPKSSKAPKAETSYKGPTIGGKRNHRALHSSTKAPRYNKSSTKAPASSNSGTKGGNRRRRRVIAKSSKAPSHKKSSKAPASNKGKRRVLSIHNVVKAPNEKSTKTPSSSSSDDIKSTRAPSSSSSDEFKSTKAPSGKRRQLWEDPMLEYYAMAF